MQWISCNRLEPSLYVGVRGSSLNPNDKPIIPVGVTPGARGQKYYDKTLAKLKSYGSPTELDDDHGSLTTILQFLRQQHCAIGV